jgi:hypothetical protein
MNARATDASNQTVLERQDLHAARENGSFNALELLAQLQKNFQANEQQTQRYVDKNTLPSLSLDDNSYLPGYHYTKAEAEAHRKDVLQSGSMSESDIQFLRTMFKQEEKEQNKQLNDVAQQSGVKSNGDKTEGTAQKDQPEQGIKGRKFELSAEAEDNAWKEWQVRLNKQIGQTLDKLVKEGKIPRGATGSASYKVAADGRYVFSYVAEPAAYARVIGAALNDTFNHHKELFKFPEGSHRSQIGRTANFSVGSETKVETGPVDDEVIKK